MTRFPIHPSPCFEPHRLLILPTTVPSAGHYEVRPAGVELPEEVPEGALHSAVERPSGADERAAVGRPPEQVQRAVGAGAQRRWGAGGARNLQGPGGQGRAGLPPEVGHPRRAHHPREGEWLHRQRRRQPLQGRHHKA
ncbi:hypothetical protein MUK42_28228 [Musa troglodytarum]|uniref:Uncharacterized protein n=1 Tax=Musa troglodytarum TaxID=320322 RepID=A0A9E7K9U0_9LILI|nr:hypothetical protein MUK42_28228 [Musa troglodytarum]